MGWPRNYGGQDASYIEQMVFAMEAAYLGHSPVFPWVSAARGGSGRPFMLYGNEQQRMNICP